MKHTRYIFMAGVLFAISPTCLLIAYQEASYHKDAHITTHEIDNANVKYYDRHMNENISYDSSNFTASGGGNRSGKRSSGTFSGHSSSRGGSSTRRAAGHSGRR